MLLSGARRAAPLGKNWTAAGCTAEAAEDRTMKPTLGASTLLDRLSHKRCDAPFLRALQADPTTRFMILVADKPVIVSNEARDWAAVRWFEPREIDRMGLPVTDPIFLGIDRQTGAGHFALSLVAVSADLAAGAAEPLHPLVDLRTLATQGVMSADEVSLIGKAKSLASWHHTSRCCGRCGGATASTEGGWKRTCWACGHDVFPRIDPVVIMLVTDGQQCVLGHEPRFPERMYSTIAGYIEPGEDIEHAVRRETHEEIGLTVGAVNVLAAQPWPFPHSLMIGCVGWTTQREIRIDPHEIVDARWFSRGDCRMMLSGGHPDGIWVPGKQSIAHALISAFATGSI